MDILTIYARATAEVGMAIGIGSPFSIPFEYRYRVLPEESITVSIPSTQYSPSLVISFAWLRSSLFLSGDETLRAAKPSASARSLYAFFSNDDLVLLDMQNTKEKNNNKKKQLRRFHPKQREGEAGDDEARGSVGSQRCALPAKERS